MSSPDARALLANELLGVAARVARADDLARAVRYEAQRIDPAAANEFDSLDRDLCDPMDNVGGPVWLVWLASMLWGHRLRERWERAQRRPPAILLHHLDPIRQIVGPDVRFDESRSALVGGRGAIVAEVPVGLDVGVVEALRRAPALLRSPSGHRLRYALAAGVHARLAAGVPEPLVLSYRGANDFAEAVGCRYGQVADLLDAHTYCQLDGGGHRIRGLLVWRQEWPHRSRRAEVVITASDLFLPRSKPELDAMGVPPGEERYYVPLLDPARVPVVGHRSGHGAQLVYQLDVLSLLARRADMLAERGGVAITARRLERLADDLHVGNHERVLATWLSGDSSRPPLLERVSPDHYHLSAEHPRERESLENLGRRIASGRARGRKRRRKRQ